MHFFTSDLHFHHRNIVRFTDRSVFTTQEEHDENLIKIWNKQVTAGDLVYHLGDFSFSRKLSDVTSILERLNGRIVMIKGNHDNSDVLRALRGHAKIAAIYDYKEIKIKEVPTVLFHFPITSWHRQSHGSFHLHGHSHGNLKSELIRTRQMDVGIDSAYTIFFEHRLFTEDDVYDLLSTEEVSIADEHRSSTANL